MNTNNVTTGTVLFTGTSPSSLPSLGYLFTVVSKYLLDGWMNLCTRSAFTLSSKHPAYLEVQLQKKNCKKNHFMPVKYSHFLGIAALASILIFSLTLPQSLTALLSPHHLHQGIAPSPVLISTLVEAIYRL